MAAEADRAGSRFVITIVPIKVQVLDPTGEKLRKAFPALASQLDMNLIEDAFVPRLERIGGVAIVDLLPLFRMQATPDYWGKRDEHLSPRGHEAWFAALQKPVRTALGLQAN
jgi:hypothetical protein